MERYINFVMKNPVKVILFIFAVTAFFAQGLFKIEFESSLDSVMPKKDEQYILNEKIKKIHGNNGKFVIAAVSSKNVMRHDFLKSFENLHQDLEEYKKYDSAKESKRLEILKQAESYGQIHKTELLQKFSEDQIFTRYLLRAFKILKTDPEILGRKELAQIVKKAETSKKIKESRIIDLIVSPYTIRDIKGENDYLITFDLIEKDVYGKRIIPETDDEIKSFQDKLTNNPAFEKGIYCKNPDTGKITDFGIMLRLKDSFVYDPIVNEINDISKGYKQLNIVVQGIPVIYEKINEYMKRDLSRFLPLVFAVVLLIFYLNFKTVKGMIIPFTVLSMADIWVIGLMGHLGYKLTIVGISLPPLMIAVGSSYSIHILNQYYIEPESPDKKNSFKRISSAMSHISLTVILAGATTFIGFFMLIVNQVSSVREMGVFSAAGVLFAVFISISFIPAFLSVFRGFSSLKNQKSQKGAGLVDAIISVLSKWVINHSRSTLIILMIICFISIAGLMRIVVETSVHAYFKHDDPIIKSSKFIGEKFGGSFGLNIIIDSDTKDGIKNPEILKFIEKFRKWLESEENTDLNIGRTDSITDFIKTMNLAMNNNKPEYYKIPDKKIDIESYISVYPGRDDNDDGVADDFEPYVDRYFKSTNILARIWEKEGRLISSGIMNHIDEKISSYLDENLPQGYTYKTAGEPKIIVKLSEYVVNGQIMSLSFSLISVSIIVFLLFRNFYAAVVSLIPICSAVLFNFGIMGWLGIRLDLATSIIASITIGIGIDDTVHFLNTYRHSCRQGLSSEEAVFLTLNKAGKAIIYTTLALTFGFLVLVISSFKPIIYFALLIAGTMISATVGALVFLPAVIIAFNLDLSPAGKKSSAKKIIDFFKVFKFSN
ncbi:MAG: RND family transporter [Desulfobacteraceae bacterium]